MPLNSTQLFVQGLLDGLPIPGSTQTLEAYITPPTVDELDNPKAYVWGGRLRGTRQSMPRGQGFKRLNWNVDVWLTYETNPDGPSVDQEFPLIVDAVMNKVWTTPMNDTFITDPTTGVKSQILAIGEDFDFEYPPERVPATLRMLYYTARLGLNVYEAVQA
ncbi:hypothetical protein ABT186_02135 [Streptomyces sp. NPDC001634]|uniref:hypothetical protein n=1 Tax=Streptomyces sp. NPDC001634 TaxID=3154390 RepID=UPI0033308E23